MSVFLGFEPFLLSNSEALFLFFLFNKCILLIFWHSLGLVSKSGHFEIIARFTKIGCQKIARKVFFYCLDEFFKKRAYEKVNFTSAPIAYWLKTSLKYSFCQR